MTVDWKRRRRWTRARLLLRQNAVALLLVVVWFAGNWAAFAYVLRRGPGAALRATFYFATDPSPWGNFYQTFSDFVVFGLIISVLATNLRRRYRPEETCRLLAAQSREHVVVVGYNNFGRRVCELLWREGGAVVVIEPDAAVVEGLVRDEHPLVLGTGRDAADFDAAAVARAAVVVIASDDLETAAVACRLVRHANPRCTLICRCADDDTGEVLGKAYAAQIVSTSRFAARYVANFMDRHDSRDVVLLGRNHVADRLLAVLRERRVAHRVVDPRADALSGLDAAVAVRGAPSDPDALARAGVPAADLVVVTTDDLGENLVVVDRIRDVNPTCKIVCRAFHEDAAQLLTQKPFHCAVISTSRHAVEALVHEGAFTQAGVGPGAVATPRARR